jgi:hypothetical protein
MSPAREKASTARLSASPAGGRALGLLVGVVGLVGLGAAGCRSATRPDPSAPVTTAPPGAQPGSAPGAAPAGLLQAHEYRFDGLKLGDRFATAVLSRPAYQRPCDDDPVDKKSRRAMVYGGRPCRGSAFPEGTSVVFLLPYAPNPREEALNQPVLVFAFLGGTYFHRRSNFPLRAGDPASRTALLGPVEATVSFPGYDTTLRAERHPGDVYALLDGDRVVGGLLGAMPADPASEQWDVILQMYERYTKER